ncbi:MAG: hypothetical protein DCC75_12335 [Proteobacteria bacterium]|nr:MAG: hypothetical protein DCC75_12335 [Pseudomonadota bacterium]
MPIESDTAVEPSQAAEETLSKVYAKLGDAGFNAEALMDKAERKLGKIENSTSGDGQKGSAAEVPALESIKDAEEEPLQVVAAAGESETEKKGKRGAEPILSAPDTVKSEKASAEAQAADLSAIQRTLDSDESQHIVVEGAESKPKVRVLGQAALSNQDTAKAPTLGETLKAEKAAVENSASRKLEKIEEKPEQIKSGVTIGSEETSLTDRQKAKLTAEKIKAPAAKQAVSGDQKAVTKISRGWYAQVAAPKSLSEAQKLTNSLRGSGFEVVIENASVRGVQYYRVLVGPETTKDRGDRLISQVKREPYIKGDPFLRVVK